MVFFELSKHLLTSAADFYPSSRPASMSTDYLKRILTSKVYDVAVESPLELAPQVSARIHNKVWLKREDTQPVFSFKLRGAYNKMANLRSEEHTSELQSLMRISYAVFSLNKQNKI